MIFCCPPCSPVKLEGHISMFQFWLSTQLAFYFAFSLRPDLSLFLWFNSSSALLFVPFFLAFSLITNQFHDIL
jgi:hypothetical protein